MTKRLSTPAMVELFQAGASTRLIAETLGCSKQTVLHRLRTAGVEPLGAGRRALRRPWISTDDIVVRYTGGESMKVIAAALDCSQRTVAMRLAKAGVPSRGSGRPGRRGAASPTWKGGRTLYRHGYWLVNIDGTPTLEHRQVMAAERGRPLESTEIVHHINSIPGDNRTGNLVIVSRSDHKRLHAFQERRCKLGHPPPPAGTWLALFVAGRACPECSQIMEGAV